MVNIVDKRTAFRYLCECGGSQYPAQDLEECVQVCHLYGPCAVYKLRTTPLSKYVYQFDLFIDEELKKGGD